MKSGKKNEARDKFIDAIIAEPYTRTAWVGLIQWGQHHNVQLAHPRVDTASDVSSENGKTNITLDMNMPGKNDGSESWLVYGITRAAWMNEKFAKEFPNEKKYRHSLREEIDTLSTVVSLAEAKLKEGKLKEKSLDVSITNLLKLKNAGLLEAFVLLAKPDAGIAQDYEAYRKNHRDRLRQYLTDYVTAGSR
jgi:hypothetical protein